MRSLHGFERLLTHQNCVDPFKASANLAFYSVVSADRFLTIFKLARF